MFICVNMSTFDELASGANLILEFFFGFPHYIIYAHALNYTLYFFFIGFISREVISRGLVVARGERFKAAWR